MEMKWPIYIVADEPRVRRRFWSQERRVRAAAREAIGASAPGEFVVSLPLPHINNKNKHLPIVFVVGHRGGTITSILTISVTT